MRDLNEMARDADRDIRREDARRTDGKFGTQTRGEASASIGASLMDNDGPARETLRCSSITLTRKNLKARNLKNTERLVILDGYASGSKFDVEGPADGTPMTVELRSGFHDLNVKSGNVTVLANSTFGNPITASGSAKVTVRAGFGCKVSLTRSEAASLTVNGDTSRVTLFDTDTREFLEGEEISARQDNENAGN